MVFTREIKISKSEFREIAKLLTWGDRNFGEDLAIVKTAVFDDGLEMDIKCCGVQWEEFGDNTAWTEAVLFRNGSEVCCTEPCDNFLGEWELPYGNDTYVVNVILDDCA